MVEGITVEFPRFEESVMSLYKFMIYQSLYA